MEAYFGTVNWIAIGLGTLISYLLGGFWYSPSMFGEKWAAGTRGDAGSSDHQPWSALILQLVGTILLAWLIALAAANGTWISAFLIVSTVVILMTANNLFAGHSHYATAVQAGFVVVMALIMSLCIALLS